MQEYDRASPGGALALALNATVIVPEKRPSLTAAEPEPEPTIEPGSVEPSAVRWAVQFTSTRRAAGMFSRVTGILIVKSTAAAGAAAINVRNTGTEKIKRVMWHLQSIIYSPRSLNGAVVTVTGLNGAVAVGPEPGAGSGPPVKRNPAAETVTGRNGVAAVGPEPAAGSGPPVRRKPAAATVTGRNGPGAVAGAGALARSGGGVELDEADELEEPEGVPLAGAGVLARSGGGGVPDALDELEPDEPEELDELDEVPPVEDAPVPEAPPLESGVEEETALPDELDWEPPCCWLELCCDCEPWPAGVLAG